MELNKGQKEVMAAFGDAVKAEREAFVKEALENMNLHNTITGLVHRTLESINHLDGQESEDLEKFLVEQMQEYTRRGLRRAVKGIIKEAESHE